MSDEEPVWRKAEGSLGCAACGDCCDPVMLLWDPAEDLLLWSTEALEGIADPRDDAGFEQWKRLGAWTDENRAEAIQAYDPEGHRRRNADFIAEHWQVVADDRRQSPRVRLAVRCDAFDSDSRLCTAHSDRPPICEGFPHYGRPPSDQGLDPSLKRCSYLRDFPRSTWPEGARPLIPVTVLPRVR